MIRPVAIGVALALGLVIVLSSTLKTAPLWQVWAALSLALTAASGTVFAYGLERWRELTALRAVRVRELIRPVGALFLVALLLGVLNVILSASASAPASGRGWALSVIAVAGALPAVATMLGIRRATRLPEPGPGRRVAVLIALRRLLQRLLAAVGTLVALATLALGSTPVPLPSRTVVLIFGGVGSLLVALAYSPARAALQEAATRLCDDLLPLADVDDAATVLTRAEDRAKLEQLLGADRNLLAELQTGLAILGPLLSSAAAAFLPSSAG
ncbi:hypothetical protein GCM10009555_080380 [Acrocarpospora macrocephala]|uniref:Uncharacterized protein n=1 Tax=Acrocarpospora macrocephala TaxID=150177 RepID=A0A5M3WMS2_9ACTN|nr:hypothetical protein [Acrocarpospora macrocephala]GES10184.1 hypothetical protein Amac_037810 [Acrocarpospora macrocephala]